MRLLLSTAFIPEASKEKGYGTNHDINATYETTDARTKKLQQKNRPGTVSKKLLKDLNHVDITKTCLFKYTENFSTKK